jgi:glycosyltransferase involved in cell wall biosynthesis
VAENEKLFSIVIPAFNSLPYVLETVETALGQTYPNLEVIVDDNTSMDGTAEQLLNRFGNNPRFKFFSNQEDLNIPHGWNRGLARAKGEYLLLLHSDNLLHPKYAQCIVNQMDKFQAEVAYSECIYFEAGAPKDLFNPNASEEVPVTYLNAGPRAVDYVFRFQRMIPTSAVTIRHSCFANRPPFDPRYLWDPDIELMTWLARKYTVVHLISPLAGIRTHGGQVASWKNKSFSRQYRNLLQLTHRSANNEPHQFLLHWAGANQDICLKLSRVQKVSFGTYLKYQGRWVGAELRVLGHFLRYFARKIRLMNQCGWQFLLHRFARD